MPGEFAEPADKKGLNALGVSGNVCCVAIPLLLSPVEGVSSALPGTRERILYVLRSPEHLAISIGLGTLPNRDRPAAVPDGRGGLDDVP